MAASSLNSIRVRLYFDYPPPATPECRMCWLLVDLNKCRVVADLSSIIKEKFGYSHKTLLDLFIEDCYLTTTENIYIVRDNDSIRVKVSSSVFVNGGEDYQNCETHNSKGKKRGREDAVQVSATQASSKKQKQEDAQINGSAPADTGKKKKQKKKKKKKSANNPSTPQKTIQLKEQANSSSKTNRKSTSSVSTSDKSTRAKNQELTTSTSDSSEEESHSKPSPPRPKQTGTTKKGTVATRKEASSSDSSDGAVKPSTSKSNIAVTPKPVPLPVTPKLSSSLISKIPIQTPKQRKSSTDSSSFSSSSSPNQVKPSAKKSQVACQLPSTTQNCPDLSVSASGYKKTQNETESSDSEASEIELVIKKPNLQGMGLNIAGLRSSTVESAGRTRGNTSGQEKGRGRGGNRGSGRGGFGRARGTPWKQDLHYNYENGEELQQRDSLHNDSFIIQNPPEPEPVPLRDYTTLPLLAAPPAVGQKIAFKLLELTENYTPHVSEYKEGKIVAFHPQTKMIELELLSQRQAPTEPGKFDLVYENPDGSERVEYAVTHGSQLTECWDSLLEPRLIVENNR
ncbi:Coilin p80-coilin [Triplophysa tibetana]|uniref:Coilin p80-coilin n=1 Tax=Triplophysa tibetana TaxID=1572043 RepID=A0A5A9N985_9TELE|nr:Coilin p80-coilin [Triplophysa tibetana]